jgi:hypothetical protein
MNKNILLFLSITVASGAFFINVYNSVVDAASWGSHIPESLETARQYYSTYTPATFLRVFSPLNQLLALLALIVFWKSTPAVRKYLGIALVMYIVTDVLTFGYFYPRIAIMFETGTDVTALTQAWKEWSAMNWVRSLVILVGVFFSSLSLHRIYRPS